MEKNTWLGLEAYQNPNDVWITQEIISAVRPDYIIEAGTRYGGSALIWAMVLKEVNPDGKVITIDIAQPPQSFFDTEIYKEGIEFILGSSTAPEIVSSIADRVKNKKVLVILDSDHSKQHVLDELKAYSPMISLNSYLIVQDSNINGHPTFHSSGPGPMEAIIAFMENNTDFVIDKSKERLMLTFNPSGYLKRVQ